MMKGDAKGKPLQPPHHEHQDRGRSTGAALTADRRCDAPQLPGGQPCLPKNWREWKRPSATRPSFAPGSRTSAATARTSSSTPWGAIWHRSRLTCPSRQQLGSYLLDALDPELAAYIKFHIEVVECPYCQANLADLERRQSGPPSATTTGRRDRIFKVVQDLLGEDRRGS